VIPLNIRKLQDLARPLLVRMDGNKFGSSNTLDSIDNKFGSSNTLDSIKKLEVLNSASN
jgi:hypothetical protein